MKKSLLISEQDSIAAILENDRVVEFFVNRGELLLGDIYSASVENILPGIDAAFVNLGKDKMGFLHANDVPGQGPLKERLVPKQKLLVQITKEPTGHKGPRVSTAISLPGRFLVLVPEERGVSISRRISEARERARLKSVVNLMKPPGIGLIIRTEAKGQGEGELFEDFEQLWDRWQTVVSEGEASIGSALIYRDQDLLYRVIRDAYSHDVTEIICDSADGQRRAQEYLQGWAGKQTRVTHHPGDSSLLVSRGVDKEIEAALSDRVELPSGGHLNIQPTEALTVIDVNSGRFTSSRTQAETVRRTNLEASQEIPRQLRLRNIGGMVIVDFIDMDSRKDQQQVLEVFQRALEEDRAKPQIGQLSDLGLVELTRRRQGQSLRELFTVHCSSCAGLGVVPTLELGLGDNKRVISFKAREEELNRARSGRRPNRGGGPVLRAATAINGRVMPTVGEEPDDEDALAGVPEDILAQMPEELLQGPGRAGVVSSKFGGYSPGEDEETEEEESASPYLGVGSNKESLFEHDLTDGAEDEAESELSNQLVQNVSAVEKVYQDLGNRLAVAELENVSSFASLSSEEASAITEPEENSYEPESSFETEFDPVTGIYRLKTKSTTSGHEDHPEHSPDQEHSQSNALDFSLHAQREEESATSEGQRQMSYRLNPFEHEGQSHDEGAREGEESSRAEQKAENEHQPAGSEDH